MRDGDIARLRGARCLGCPVYLHFEKVVPEKRKGVMMRRGERFCMFEKKARRFLPSESEMTIPNWCPRRKNPCELRIYSFRSVDEAAMHHAVCSRIGSPVEPSCYQCALAYELHTELTPLEFWIQCAEKSDAELLGAAVHLYHVVEIDDGVKPVFFYKTMKGYRVMVSFHAEQARKNKREEYA